MGLFDLITIENSTFNSAPWKYGDDYWSSFELYPEWGGRSFYVFKGVAHHQRDYLTRTMVAVKTLKNKTGRPGCWEYYKMRSEVARRISREFNELLESNSCRIRINFLKPIEAEMENVSDIMTVTRFLMAFDKKLEKNEVVLFEELLEEKFNYYVTSVGRTTPNGCDVLDAFCHYTYESSRGELVVCNLKGNEEDGQYNLTNPTIHSRSGSHGEYDKGESGIRTFFENHICNSICRQFQRLGHVIPNAPSVRSELRDDSGEDNVSEIPPQYNTIYPNGQPSNDEMEQPVTS